MKILKEGELPKIEPSIDRTFTGTCGHCGCRIQFLESEATNIPGNSGVYYCRPEQFIVRCPTEGCTYKPRLRGELFIFASIIFAEGKEFETIDYLDSWFPEISEDFSEPAQKRKPWWKFSKH